MEQVIEACLDAIRNHRVQESAFHLNAISATLTERGKELGRRRRRRWSLDSERSDAASSMASLIPMKIITLLQEGLNSQAVVNHSEGSGAILGCVSSFLSLGTKLHLQDNSYSHALLWQTITLCKQILRYHVRSLFFFIKSGSVQKQVDVMRIFKSMCKLSDWIAVDMMKRVDWVKMISRCKDFSMNKKKSATSPAHKRLRSSMDDASVVRDNGVDNMEVDADAEEEEEFVLVTSARESFVDFMLALIELDHKDIWDQLCALPILMKTLLMGLPSDSDKDRVYRVVDRLKKYLFGGKSWRHLSMERRHKLFQQQHLRLLSFLLDVPDSESESSRSVSKLVAELLTNLCSRAHDWSLFPLEEKDFLTCMLVSYSRQMNASDFHFAALDSYQYDSPASMVRTMKDYAVTINKSIKYARNLNHGKWFNDLLSKDPLVCMFFFIHWKPNTSQQPSVIDLASTASFIEWMSTVSLIIGVLSEMKHFFKSIHVNILKNDFSHFSGSRSEAFFDACYSALVLPSVAVEKNVIVTSLQNALLHGNTLAAHKLLQLHHVLMENCWDFVALFRGYEVAHAECSNHLEQKGLKLLPDMKFLILVHIHFRDELYHKPEEKKPSNEEGECNGTGEKASDHDMQGIVEQARRSASCQELILLQSLSSLKELGKTYTLLGYNWGNEASKCISEGFLGYSVRHKVQLLEYLQLAANSGEEVTFSSSWKVLSLLFHVLLESTQYEAIHVSAENLTMRLLTNTRLFEAYPGEVGIWMHNLKLAKHKRSEAKSMSLLIDFFCQALYQTGGKVTDFVYFLQNVCSETEVVGNCMNNEKFGPLILLAVQQCCSFLKSQKRSLHEKAGVADFVCSVASDLISLSTQSTLLHQSILQLLKEGGHDRGSLSDFEHEKILASLFDQCNQTLEGTGKSCGPELLPYTVQQISCFPESLDMLSFFNHLDQASELLHGMQTDSQLSNIISLRKVIDDTRLPTKETLQQYQIEDEWFGALSKSIDYVGKSIQQGTRSSVILAIQVLAMIQKMAAGKDSDSIRYLSSLEKFFLLLEQAWCRDIDGMFSVDELRFHVLSETLNHLLEMENPSGNCLSCMNNFVHYITCNGSEEEDVQKRKLQFQVSVLESLLPFTSSVDEGTLKMWHKSFLDVVVLRASKGFASCSHGLQNEYLALYLECLGRMQSHAVPLSCVSSDFTLALLKKVDKGSCKILKDLLESNMGVARVFASFVSHSWIEDLTGQHFGLLCPCFVKYFEFLVRGSEYTCKPEKGAVGKGVQKHSHIASLCFDRALSRLFQMDLSASMASNVALLLETLIEYCDYFEIDVAPRVNALKGNDRISTSINKDQIKDFVAPLLTSISAAKAKMPAEALCNYASFLLHFFERNSIFTSIVECAKSSKGSKTSLSSLLRCTLDITSFLLEKKQFDVPPELIGMVKNLIPIVIRSAFTDPGILEHMENFFTSTSMLLIKGHQGNESGKVLNQGEWFVQYSTEVVDLIVSHSSFKKLLFEERLARDRMRENQAYLKTILEKKDWEYASKTLICRRQKVFHVLEHLLSLGNSYSLYESEEGMQQCQQLHSMLLSAFSCHADPGDAGLLQVMKILSKENSLGYLAKHHFLWGEAFRRYYTCKMELVDQRDALKAIVLNLQLPEISADAIVRTIHFILGKKESAIGVYDPCFLLNFMKHHMHLRTIDHEAAICKGFLSLALVCLSSPDKDLRGLAHDTLDTFCSAASSFDFKDCNNIQDLLEKIKLMVPEMEDRVPAPAAVLLAELVPRLMYERDFMHSNAKKLLGRESTFDTSNIPVFLDLLHSCSPDFLKYQKWLLKFLQLCLADEEDFPPFRKRFAFEVLMGFSSSSFSQPGILKEILVLLKEASKFEKFTYELLYKRNVVTWLAGIIATSKQVRNSASLMEIAMETMLSILQTAGRCKWDFGLSIYEDVSSLMCSLAEIIGEDVRGMSLLCKILIELIRVSGPGVEVLSLTQWHGILRAIAKLDDATCLKLGVVLTCLLQGNSRDAHPQDTATARAVFDLSTGILSTKLDAFARAETILGDAEDGKVCTCFLLYLAILSAKGSALPAAAKLSWPLCMLLEKAYHLRSRGCSAARLVLLNVLVNSCGLEEIEGPRLARTKRPLPQNIADILAEELNSVALGGAHFPPKEERSDEGRFCTHREEELLRQITERVLLRGPRD